MKLLKLNSRPIFTGPPLDFFADPLPLNSVECHTWSDGDDLVALKPQRQPTLGTGQRQVERVGILCPPVVLAWFANMIIEEDRSSPEFSSVHVSRRRFPFIPPL
jgi:hypothetical protein